ncbi:HlyD family efflux transporter periplasmic adaptor subunit [Gordonia hongkongensis]|uniref:HlyD family efflux transporter periplasmic adaptor subunit n=1 Tax=Gordonia hongkongensis TaxID=1701090 RepID=UPI003D750667
MSITKAINLVVRPVKSVDLSFATDGIIDTMRDPILGTKVEGSNLDEIYAKLGDVLFSPQFIKSPLLKNWNRPIFYKYPDGSRLICDADFIRDSLGRDIVATLRAEDVEAELQRAIDLRENAFLTRYSKPVIGELQKIFGPGTSSRMPSALANLRRAEERRWTSLRTGYNNRGIGVVETTDTETTSAADVTPLSNSSQQAFHNESTSTAHTKNYELRQPKYDNDIRYYRALVSLLQDELSAFRMKEMVRYKNVTFRNELEAIDMDVRRVQIAYIDHLLVPPFGGTVTGVFHGVGDYVRAGEPIIRIEDDRSVYLVGVIKHRGIIRIGDRLTVKTTLFGTAGGTSINLEGTIAAVRGHSAIDEQWELLAVCNNVGPSGKSILPINYNFDFDGTEVVVLNN